MTAEYTMICRAAQSALTVKEYCEFVRHLLQSLSNLDPAFAHWAVGRGSTAFSVVEILNSDLSNLSTILCEELTLQAEKYPGDFLYEKDSPDFNHARCAVGMRSTFYTVVESEQGFDWEQPYFKLNVTGGASSWELSGINCLFSFPKNSRSDIYDIDFIKRVLFLFIEMTQAHTAFFDSSVFKRALNSQINHNKLIKLSHELQTKTVNGMGLIHYVNYPLRGCLKTQIPCVAYNHGSLMTVSENVYHPSEEEIALAAQLYNEMLDKNLFTSEYTFSGLPSSMMEQDYISQMTGAHERGRYQVDYVFFDGYDSTRGVLLYARLLAVPNDSRNLTVEQYLNYSGVKRELISTAKRHLAVIKARHSEDTIEWHIGLQPQANLIAAFFEKEGIDEKKLTIKYTPNDPSSKNS